MRERRKANRFSLTYRTPVFNAETDQQIGSLMDISMQGAMLVSDTPIPTGKIFRLKLSLEKEISDQPFLELKAISIWCHPDIKPNSYNIGFELLDTKSEETEIISRIAVTYGI